MSNSPRNSRSANSNASRIVLERSLSHGRRDESIALLTADQFGDFVGAAAFKTNHAQSVERHGFSL